jgi:hypothetical protein
MLGVTLNPPVSAGTTTLKNLKENDMNRKLMSLATTGRPIRLFAAILFSLTLIATSASALTETILHTFTARRMEPIPSALWSPIVTAISTV